MWIDLIIYTPMYVTGFWALVLVLSSGKKNRAKQFLGFFMILAFGVYFSHALFFQKQYVAYLFFDPVYLFSSLSVYPMYYLYIRLLTVESNLKLKSLIQLLPDLIFGLASAVVYMLMTPADRSDYVLSYLFRIKEVKAESELFVIQYMQNYTVIDLAEDEQVQPELSMKEYNQTQIKDRLIELFDNQQIYKQCDLKITLVSLKLQTNRTYVSNLINTEFKCSFSEFVNNYRIAEAKKLLADSTHQNYSLDYISDISGFGSIHSFIRTFKEREGITPGKFRTKLFLNENAT